MTVRCHLSALGLVFRLSIFGSVLLLFSLAAFSQTETATLTGTITDPSGAIVANASVQVTNVETGVTTRRVSNGSGLYVVPNLAPGHYRVIVEKAGFKQMALTDLTLNVQDIISRNFQMQVGTVSESITVSGEGVNINTESAAVSTVIDQTYVANMPLNGRSFQDLILLTPGVVTETSQIGTVTSALHGPGLSGEFSVNGQRTESNYYTVDGVSANVGAIGTNMVEGAGPSGSVPASTALGTTQALVSVDDLQEFRVQSSTYSAEYGRNPGGQFAFETKSGTNQWHGTAYDYVRNNYFDSNDWFTNYHSSKQAALRQNDFGGTLGGPVRIPGLYNGKDKTFFFVSYEGLRLTQPQPVVPSDVPDNCMRGVTADCVSGRVPAPSVLQPVIHAFPVPNGREETCTLSTDPACPPSGQEGLAQFIASWSNPSRIDSTSVRFDHVVSGKLRLFFRFSGTPSTSAVRPASGLSPSVNFTTASTVRTYTAGATSLLTSRLSNDFRLNYSSNEARNHYSIDAFGGSTPLNLSALLGLGSTAQSAVGFIPGSYTAILSQEPDSAAQRQWNWVDTLSFSVGRHQFKFGVDYRRLAPLAIPTNPGISYYYFDEPSVESNSAGYTIAQSLGRAYPLYKNFSAFAEDEWRVSAHLNISMGLRWEVNPPPGVTRGLQAYTVQGSSPDTWQLAPQGTRLWNTEWYNFAPRLGAAYVVRDRQGWETVIRGGGGVFFDTGQQLGSLGFLGPGFFAFNPGSGSFPVLPSIPPLINPPQSVNQSYGSLPTVFPDHLQLPYTLQWNASAEQALGKSQTFTLSYVGSHASRLLQFQTITIPNNPNATQWNVVGTGLTSDYDAMQAEFQRRLTQGLTALASYTWSQCIDYGSMNFTSGYERGDCAFDVRHNFSGVSPMTCRMRDTMAS